MIPEARKIIEEVAARRGVDPTEIVMKCRSQRVFRARVEIARQLDAGGYNTMKISAILGQERTTIIYYLGRAKKRPSPEPPGLDRRRWRKPRVKHLEWITPQQQPKTTRLRLYLVPYAGADWTDYRWKERKHGKTIEDQSRRQGGADQAVA